ncbi:dual E2 ubiquitin-conjugating enzyme/E3 ubiquitin-protein ligase BIRC6-like isoform X2 [Ptychodera flava]|uniref:dual E2 ubiquitin-conjugating enzyme/E3 ubiquitin-protein ligase BIRC6-like isoform X2 n=1 Tax=Ptychodera flava TaxID=63121 RepID=UPI00396A72E4
MAACKEATACALLLEEFESWRNKTGSDAIFLLESGSQDDGCVLLQLLLAGEHEFRLLCPSGYPNHEDNFFVESGPAVRLWCNALNEYLLDAPTRLMLKDVLTKAIGLHGNGGRSSSPEVSDDEDGMDESDEEEDHEAMMMSDDDDDSTFTTKWELDIARKKKRWAEKEAEIREEMKRRKRAKAVVDGTELEVLQASDQEQEQAKQIFSNTAASGVLTNDLVKILESEKKLGLSAEPIDDNIYKWSVRLFDFEQDSFIASDLEAIESKHGYNYIQLEMDFAIDLFPFYPPLVKVIRPRLQDSMMQRVTNMEMLKLSFWNPTKDMKTVLSEIKGYLQNWARLELDSQRNDPKRYPKGSYVDIEHHLLRLALVSEISPRANLKYSIDVEKPPEIRLAAEESKKKEYWTKGVGYGHRHRPGWDIAAYIAAQKEKDKQIESVLNCILVELRHLFQSYGPSHLVSKASGTCNKGKCDKSGDCKKTPVASTSYASPSKASCSVCNSVNDTATNSGSPKLTANAATAAASAANSPSTSQTVLTTSRCSSGYNSANASTSSSSSSSSNSNSSCSSGDEGVLEPVDPVSDVYSILEGSALVPFLESYLKDVSFLEICRHTMLYKAILDIIREIAVQPKLVGLLCALPHQQQSVYEHLEVLEGKANMLLERMGKAANGSIPKAPKKDHPKEQKIETWVIHDLFGPIEHVVQTLPTDPPKSSVVEKTAEEKLARGFATLFQIVSNAVSRHGKDAKGNSANDETVSMDISISTDEEPLDVRYKRALKELQFDSCEIPTSGAHIHHYASQFDKAAKPLSSQVFRLAQEFTSLSSSLPLDLSSAIFVRTDDEKINLMQALIIGPEGTPYSGGCYLFDIFFPSNYPKVPPQVNLQTTGNGSVRFNPNLYNSGKVCLSLLGTWEGQGGEQWNETSTVLQVLISIQSLILVAEPYFNEPGYEQEIGTDSGRKHSKEYNQEVKINNIKYAMVAQLQRPPPGLEEVIQTHFYLKRDKILQEVEGWLKDNPKDTKMQKQVTNLRTELKKLQKPDGLQESCKQSSA